ncbi:hypothetical protein BBK36DRAFT_1125295 [Trichoderma citrinoviride]|uniref:DNA2/NAM7 helicase helicase domain-containing protein n=1 Tax=Trichoderma citrinoviride TaxID=58853 RepID=A0A2T4B361_9HYPO|nr:hypothetical protein BBK36DRAFT_1125295 [Trichoderma citrinoviride]PTB63766.1 hypothetical protein BBK36DRAFT_1125295 [Trichoderma citrinoviride]
MRHAHRRRRGIRVPAGCFVNQEHRKHTLIKGLSNEMTWTEQLTRECGETTFRAHLLPFPSSAWIPRGTDMEVFGMAATNEPRAYLMTIGLDDIRHVLPSIGSTVKVELDVDQIFHTAPNFCLEGDALDALTTAIQIGLRLVERTAYGAVKDADKSADELLRDEGCEGDKIRWQEIMNSLTLDEYEKRAKDYLFGYNARVSNEAILAVPSGDTEMRRMYDARRFALQLREKPGESKDEHTRRIQDWIREKEVTCQIPVAKQPLVGHRIKLPPGITAGVALFVLEVPLQPYWLDGYRSPPMTLHVPKQTWPADLSNYFDNINKEESPKAVCAQICYEVNTETFLMEDWAVEKMSRLQKESLGNDWWDFSTRFHDIPASERTDLLRWFPALQKRLGKGIFEGEYAKVVEAMARSRAGKIIINAPEGPTRSNFALSVAQAVMSEAPDPPAAVSSRLDVGDSRHVQYSSWELENERSTYNQFQMAMWNNMSAEEKDLSRKKKDEFVPVNGRVAWIAPQDKQVDEAVQRLVAMNPGKIILRLYSYNAEINNLLQAGTESAVAVVASGRTTAETQIIEAYNSCLLEKDKKRNPASNKHSWSEQCLSRGLFNKPESWPEMSAAERSIYWENAEDALSYLLERADAICATPSAFRSIDRRVGSSEWGPSFIIVDNVNQLTEPLSLLPVAMFPDVPTMFIGDLEQDDPVVMAPENLRTSTAAKRRTRSLLQRVEDAGYLDHQLFPGR